MKVKWVTGGETQDIWWGEELSIDQVLRAGGAGI
jgi:hypothetical protein